MNTHLEEWLEKVNSLMKTEANTKIVFDEQFQLGRFKCLPLLRIKIGPGTTNNGGMNIEPIGFLVAKGRHIRFLATTTHEELARALESIPEPVEHFMEMEEEVFA